MGNTDLKDNKIIEDLFRTHYKSLKIYAYRFLKNATIAEDIVQDVFVELWNRRKYIEFDGAVKSYLFKSTYNRSLNYLNSKSYTSTQKNDFDIICIDNADENPYNDQESVLYVKSLEKEIDKCIETLPPQCRKVFLLSRKNSLKNKEVADLLDISIKSVEKHISKALSELRMHLTKEGILFAIVLTYIIYLF